MSAENFIKALDLLEKRRNKALTERDRLNMEINSMDIEILKCKQKLSKFKEDGLVVTEHAIQRFNERIIELPRQRIKTILSSAELKNKYIRYGDNRFKVKEVPGCIAVIKDGCVVTVYSSVDTDYRIDVLKKYMDEYVEYLVKKHTGQYCFMPKYRDYKKKFSL